LPATFFVAPVPVLYSSTMELFNLWRCCWQARIIKGWSKPSSPATYNLCCKSDDTLHFYILHTWATGRHNFTFLHLAHLGYRTS
jgi:hypothetical protein